VDPCVRSDVMGVGQVSSMRLLPLPVQAKHRLVKYKVMLPFGLEVTFYSLLKIILLSMT
jgi:hypothetical protein